MNCGLFCIQQLPIQGHQTAHFGQSSVTKSLQKNRRLIIVTVCGEKYRGTFE